MSIAIENDDPQYSWKTLDEVYCHLLGDPELRRRIYQLARTLYQSTNGLVLVDHELFISPLYVVHLSTEKQFTGLVRRRLWRIFAEQEMDRALAETNM
jgi:hypothetical protein